MKAHIFDSIEKLNEFLEHRKPEDVVRFRYAAQVVGQEEPEKKNIKKHAWHVVDRFVVITLD